MENSMTRTLVEMVVKNALERIKDSPERGIRNLVDMALQFSTGRFQKDFFAAAQTMLQNENSAYYGLVRDVVTHTDTDRLFTFGMNLGYNSCTVGAQRIRENEKKLNCNIPWTIFLQVDTLGFDKAQQKYERLISEGEHLGIYTWMVFASDRPKKVFALAEHHPDSAFCFFCETEDLTSALLDELEELKNIMLVIRYEDHFANIGTELRERGLLYSVWYPYGKHDLEIIINGDLFSSTQQLSPSFTVLVPKVKCPESVQRLAHQEVKRARSEQAFRTITWELQGDNCLVDSIISDDTCSVYFDSKGDLCDRNGEIEAAHHNLFQSSLTEILKSTCLKKARESK